MDLPESWQHQLQVPVSQSAQASESKYPAASSVLLYVLSVSPAVLLFTGSESILSCCRCLGDGDLHLRLQFLVGCGVELSLLGVSLIE